MPHREFPLHRSERYSLDPLDHKLELLMGAAHPYGRDLHLLDGKLELSPDLLKLSPDLGAGLQTCVAEALYRRMAGAITTDRFPGMITPPPFYFRDPQHGPSQAPWSRAAFLSAWYTGRLRMVVMWN